MPEINITVDNKIAIKADETEYICSNSDFVVNFNFDSEWEAYETKTARFSHNGGYIDVVFSGSQCAVPIIKDTYCFFVGVYAGNLHTTTPARVPCKLSILCGSSAPAAPTDDVYNQIMEKLNDISGITLEDIAQAVANYFKENPVEEKDPTVHEWAKAEEKPTYTAEEVGAIAKSELPQAIDEALAKAKASSDFDGKDGKSAYQYAVEGGYTGTETEFAEKLASGTLIVHVTDNNGTLSADKSYSDIANAIVAGTTVLVYYDGNGLPLITVTNAALYFGTIQCDSGDATNPAVVATVIIEITQNGEVNDVSAFVEIPTTLPNPNAMTFTGAVTGSYDGSAPMSVNIPTVPTKTSQITNDSGYLTLATLPKYGGESE